MLRHFYCAWNKNKPFKGKDKNGSGLFDFHLTFPRNAEEELAWQPLLFL